MTQLVIKGHTTRGKEVIELLKMLGGNNPYEYVADSDCFGFFIGNETRNIYHDWLHNFDGRDATIFTLEEFLEKFHYKVGDKVQHKGATSCGSIYEIESLRWKDNRVEYIVCILGNGSRLRFTTEDLQPYKEEAMEDKGNISDGYHTFNELYEYRLLYNASMFNEFAKQGLYDVHKSKRHSDGTIPFGDGNWFIVQAELPTGQISNHYEMKDWELFNIPEKEKANQYDGHTPQDVTKRLRDFLSLKKLVEPKFKVGDKIKDKNNREWFVGQVFKKHFDISSVPNAEGYFVLIEDQDQYELVPNKFDITTLKPFDKVLVRDNDKQKWTNDYFSFIDNKQIYSFVCIAHCAIQCIPYEGNEHLCNTTNVCDEFYKTWG